MNVALDVKNNWVRNIFSSSTLKILACVFMFMDHYGAEIKPSCETYRIIGRLAYPIFAFFIAEGCKYTKNRPKRFLTIFLTGVFCEMVYVAYSGAYYGNIMLTFSLSIILIYAMQKTRKCILKKQWDRCLSSGVCFAVLLCGVYIFCKNIYVDYGFGGVITPLLCSVFMFRKDEDRRENKWVNFIMLAIGLMLIIMQTDTAAYQSWSLLAIPILALYNGKVGIRKMKYVFYVFYPVHLGIIGIISMLIHG